MIRRGFVLAFLLAAPLFAVDAKAPRPLAVDDLFALKTLGDPQISPDGQWVAYTVRSLDAKADSSNTDVYMIPFAGGAPVQLTSSPRGENQPRFSPDGRYLAFLSGREGKQTQVWLLDRRGGEAVKLTGYKASVSDLAWSPDGKRLALVVGDVDPDEEDEEKAEADKDGLAKTPKPIVLHRLQFKRDGEGYLRELRQHIHVFDVEAKESTQVTFGRYDDADPAWSPDGKLLAFTSNRTEEPDSNDNSDVFVVEAKADAKPRALTTSPGTDRAPVFSPDGKSIVYLAGGDPKDIWYATNHVALVPVAGGAPKPLTVELDRNVEQPRFSRDGKTVYFLLEDGGNQHLARVSAAGGSVERVVAGERAVQTYALGRKDETVVLESTPDRPFEVSVAEGGSLRHLTTANDEFLKGIRLGEVRRIQATSKDCTKVDAFLTLPPGTPAKPAKRLPAILRIHGGPTAQYDTSFNTEWQMLAAQGYAVVGANPRGSTGYGRAFSRAIWADWGNKDYDDVLAAIDQAVALGFADPDRLGVGGWSYGGILTDHIIVKTGRFKAAISGASEVNYLANYGTDHYQKEWEGELGLPWENTQGWMRISPFFQVAKVTTPTLILCGQEDVNVPLLNSEQLFQALRRLGVETELVIYPGQNHGIVKPSYQKDRLERYIAWYDKYVKNAGAAKKTAEAKAP